MMLYWVAMFLLLALLVVSNWYYIDRMWLLKRSQQAEISRLREEYRMQDKMLMRLKLPDVMIGEDDGEA